MKPSDTNTFSGDFESDANARRFRNQATGMGNSLAASCATGAMRSQRVIDGAPPAQLAVADRSYPAAHPEMDVNGTLRDKLTGKPWKQIDVGPHL